ncbi:hypothetical protein BOTBODRAFT_612974 [Botryobasidium botryosum FD-172 SS1]|uniref:Transcription factor domain-containing protein n=1 Tax=Botryobasidium botryosum (strain FD-172 SS1) TaxID=930990 RepID=A0A067M5U4_BOTB1|nr:hypothetical protein BOTBODRAFT_612974 [Botryobasidium botryosum FD-172 SS1]
MENTIAGNRKNVYAIFLSRFGWRGAESRPYSAVGGPQTSHRRRASSPSSPGSSQRKSISTPMILLDRPNSMLRCMTPAQTSALTPPSEMSFSWWPAAPIPAPLLLSNQYFYGGRQNISTRLSHKWTGYWISLTHALGSRFIICIKEGPAKEYTLLQTFDRTELQRRIRVWWMVFTTNRLLSSATNMNGDIEDERIETVWDIMMPPESSDLKTYHSTVSSLFIPDSGDTWVHTDTANVIRSKCIATIGRAARFGLLAVSNDQTFWDELETVDQAIRQIAASLPSVFEESCHRAEAAQAETQSTDAGRFTVEHHLFICDAAIRLHSRLGCAGNDTSRRVCLEACQKAMPAVRRLVERDLASSVAGYLALTWFRMFREFALQYDQLRAIGAHQDADLLVLDLKVLSLALRKRAEYRPVINELIAVLRREFPSLSSVPDMF